MSIGRSGEEGLSGTSRWITNSPQTDAQVGIALVGILSLEHILLGKDAVESMIRLIGAEELEDRDERPMQS